MDLFDRISLEHVPLGDGGHPGNLSLVLLHSNAYPGLSGASHHGDVILIDVARIGPGGLRYMYACGVRELIPWDWQIALILRCRVSVCHYLSETLRVSGGLCVGLAQIKSSLWLNWHYEILLDKLGALEQVVRFLNSWTVELIIIFWPLDARGKNIEIWLFMGRSCVEFLELDLVNTLLSW